MKGYKTVYVVTQGDYSDYRIKAVFSTKPLAQGYIDIHVKYNKYDDGMCIEEYNLNKPRKFEVGLQVRMKEDGSVVEVKPTVIEDGKDVGFRFFDFVTPKNLVWIVVTDDEERAVKVVNEKRTQVIALDLWGNDKKVRGRVK